MRTQSATVAVALSGMSSIAAVTATRYAGMIRATRRTA